MIIPRKLWNFGSTQKGITFMQKAKVSLCMLENAKSWYKDNNESEITLTVHFFHILTNVRYVEFTLNT